MGRLSDWHSGAADFRDLVRNRKEFDTWIQEGAILRLSGNRIASFFTHRQRVPMPAYKNLTSRERDDLWAYVQWLDGTDGGHIGGGNPW